MLQEDKRQQLDQIVNEMVKNKESDSNIQFVVDDFKNKYGTPEQPVQSQDQGLMGQLKQRGKNIVEPMINPKATSGVLGKIMPQLNMFGQIAGGIGDIVGAGISKGTEYLTDKISDNKVVQDIATSKPVSDSLDVLQSTVGMAGLEALKTGADAYKKFADANPNVARDLENVVNIASLIPIGKGGSIVGKEGLAVYGDVAQATRRVGGVSKAEKGLGGAIDAGIEKGIRPSVVGKKTALQVEQYKNRAREAVKTIVKNKDKINIKDEFGEIVNGLPKNLDQFSQAIEQTKEAIYKKYSKLAKQAGEAGADIDLTPIAKELGGLVKSPVLQDIAPEVVNYAKKRGASLLKRGRYTAEQAQEAIKQLNSSLEAFYKNPSYGDFSKLQIDALIVNNMRKTLDSTIESAVGKGYQGLKNMYGSLKAIEKDVSKRAIVDARKNAKGLIDFTDIFSAGDIIAGVATMNPAQIGKGAFQKAIATLYKMKNDPNRIIKKMFEGAEKSLKKIDELKVPFKPKSKTLNLLKDTPAGNSVFDITRKLPDDVKEVIRKIDLPEQGNFTKKKVFGEFDFDNVDDFVMKLGRDIKKKYGLNVNTEKGRKLAEKWMKMAQEFINEDMKLKPMNKKLGFNEAGTAKSATIQDPLIQEARKYKSADEFVKAQGTPVYHGTNYEKFEPSKAVSRDGLYGKGVYFATDKNITKQYGSKTVEAFLDEGSLLKINEPLTPKQQSSLRKVMGGDEWDWSKNPTGDFVWNRLKLTKGGPEEILKKAGIKGIQHEQFVKGGKNINYTIFDESAIKTKSQLTDIWNKANKNYKSKKISVGDYSRNDGRVQVRGYNRNRATSNINSEPRLEEFRRKVLNNPGGKVATSDEVKLMSDFVTYARGKFKSNPKIEIDARRMLDKFGIKLDVSNAKLANFFTKLLDYKPKKGEALNRLLKR